MKGAHIVWLYLGNFAKRPLLFWIMYIGLYVILHFIANVQVSTALRISLLRPLTDLLITFRST